MSLLFIIGQSLKSYYHKIKTKLEAMKQELNGHKKRTMPKDCAHTVKYLYSHKQCCQPAELCEQKCPKNGHMNDGTKHEIIQINQLQTQIRSQKDRKLTLESKLRQKLQVAYRQRLTKLNEKYGQAKKQIDDILEIDQQVEQLINYVDIRKWHPLSCSNVYRLKNLDMDSRKIQSEVQKIIQEFKNNTKQISKDQRQQLITTLKKQFLRRLSMEKQRNEDEHFRKLQSSCKEFENYLNTLKINYEKLEQKRANLQSRFYQKQKQTAPSTKMDIQNSSKDAKQRNKMGDLQKQAVQKNRLSSQNVPKKNQTVPINPSNSNKEGNSNVKQAEVKKNVTSSNVQKKQHVTLAQKLQKKFNTMSEQKKGPELSGQRVQNSAPGASLPKVIQKPLQTYREQKPKADEISKTQKSKTDEPKQINSSIQPQPQTLLKNDSQPHLQKEGQKQVSKQSNPNQEPKISKQKEEVQKQKTGFADPTSMASSAKSEGVDKKQNQSKQGIKIPQLKPMDLNFSFKIFPLPNQNAFKMGQQIANPKESEYKNRPESSTSTFGNTGKIGQKKMGQAPSSFSSKFGQKINQPIIKTDYIQGPYNHPQIYKKQQIKQNILVNQQPNGKTTTINAKVKKQEKNRDEQFGLFNDEQPEIKERNNQFEPDHDINSNVKAEQQNQTFYFKRFPQEPNKQ